MRGFSTYYAILVLLLILLSVANIAFGTISVSVSQIIDVFLGNDSSIYKTIILESRLPQMLTALFAGAALAASGLMLQTLFNNPLADPSILGVSSGAGVGVAVVMLWLEGTISTLGIGGHLAILVGAMSGSLLVLAILLFFASRVKNSVMLLIVGIMVGYVASSAVSLLSFLSSSDGVFGFVMWGMGDFSAISLGKLPLFLSLVIFMLLFALMQIKPLNALLLGERYSENLGVNISKSRTIILLITGTLTSLVTAYCGPIAFLGLATPHVARLLTKSSNHNHLLPITMLLGSVVSLFCNLLSTTLTEDVAVPLNVITPCLGAPVIIYVIVNRDKIAYFNS